MDYIDTNGNGILDVFEDRPPITEILNAPPESLPCDRDSIIIEIEKRPREPKRESISSVAQTRYNKRSLVTRDSEISSWLSSASLQEHLRGMVNDPRLLLLLNHAHAGPRIHRPR